MPVGAGIPRFLRVGDGEPLRARSRTSWRTTSISLPRHGRSSRCELFRVTRNANTERDEDEADDLLAMIESELRDRRFAPIVRLEVDEGHEARAIAACSPPSSASTRTSDVFEVDGMLGCAT